MNKVAIILAVMVAVAAASPLLDALERIERGRGGRGRGGRGGGGRRGDRKPMCQDSGSSSEESSDSVGRREKERLEKMKEEMEENMKKEIQQKIMRSSFWAAEPISINALNGFKTILAEHTGAVKTLFQAAAEGTRMQPDDISKAELLQGLDMFLSALEDLGEGAEETGIDLGAILARAYIFGVGSNVACAADNMKCIKAKGEALEQAIKAKVMQVMKGVSDKMAGSELPESCDTFVSALKMAKEAESPDFTTLIAADYACIADTSNGLIEMLQNGKDADENTTGDDILKFILSLVAPSASIMKDIVQLVEPLVAHREQLFQELIAEGTIAIEPMRSLTEMVRHVRSVYRK